MNDDVNDTEVSLNHVVLRGRLAAQPEAKAMPSGDVLTLFRLTVDRPAGDRGRVDSLECVTSRSRPRRTVERANPGDIIEISGSLRRRFWRGPAGPSSRYAVEVTTARIVRRIVKVPGRATDASPGQKPASA